MCSWLSGAWPPPLAQRLCRRMNWLALATIAYAARCRPPVVEAGGRPLSDLAAGPCRQADARASGPPTGACAWEQRDRRACHLRLDHSASAAMLRLGCAKRRAVLAHERAYVANRDFYLLLLAALNRSVFWFSPFAWWHLHPAGRIGRNHQRRERRSKSSRTGCPTPRSCSTFVQRVRRAPAGIEMARPARCAAGWNAFLRATTAPAKLGSGKSHRDRTPSSCRLSSSRPARSPIAPRRCLRRRKSTRQVPATARAQAAVRLLLFIGPRVDLHRLPKATNCSARSAGSEFRLAAAGDGTYFYPAPAGPILVAVGR